MLCLSTTFTFPSALSYLHPQRIHNLYTSSCSCDLLNFSSH